MFGNALDNMLSQSSYRYGANTPANAPAPTTSPGRFLSDIPSQSSPLTGNPQGQGSPTSFFSAASPINSGGISTGSSPFGTLIPDLSKATPEQLKFITDTLSNIQYSVPLGGYVSRDQANDPNSAFNRGYYNMTVRPPSGPQNEARSVYDLIGSFPTRP